MSDRAGMNLARFLALALQLRLALGVFFPGAQSLLHADHADKDQ
jgi:hypothetical protein